MPSPAPLPAPPARISVIVWNEFRHERTRPEVAAIYPDGIHATIAAALAELPGLGPGARALDIRTATLDEPEQGLSEERLAGCDVLVWWATGRMPRSRMRSSTGCSAMCWPAWA